MIRPEGGKVVAEERFERRNNMEITSLEKRTQVFVALVFILVSGLGSVLWTVISGMEEDLDAVNDKIELKFDKVNEKLNVTVLGVAQAHEHAISHDVEKEIWVQRILDNVKAVEENRQSLSTFKNDVHARKDPFSGTQGKELHSYITANRIKIKELEKQCHAVRKYLGVL